MTPTELLLDMRAAHAARTQYAKASERWAETAIKLRRIGDPLCRSAASMANKVRKHGIEEAG